MQKIGIKIRFPENLQKNLQESLEIRIKTFDKL